jgi:hypothetical protein
MQRSHRRRTAAAAAIVITATGAGALAGLGGGAATASSHREAPLIAGDPRVDNTDVYAFVSPDKTNTVTLIANWIPFEYAQGGPNFYEFATDAQYDINIDNNADAKPDLTYRWEFRNKTVNSNTFLAQTGPVNSLNDATLNRKQFYSLKLITHTSRGPKTTVLIKNAPVVPSDVGPAAMPNYASLRQQGIKTGLGGVTSFAGQADDPFFLDLRVFDLLYGGNFSEVGHDSLSNFNVNTIALQVPKDKLAKGKNPTRNPIIGIWSATNRRSLTIDPTTGKQTPNGPYVQVSRLGNPLVNEAVVPLKFKDYFNFSKPSGDAAYLPKVVKPEVPQLIEKIYGIKAPATPRKDLVSVFLTGVKGLNMPAGKITPSEQLRLNMSIAPSANPKRLGVLDGDVAGFPNGRRLTDDVVDIELQVLEGALVGSPNKLGDGVDTNDKPFLTTFPYVALPTSGGIVRPAG